jgi:hypothetical protein
MAKIAGDDMTGGAECIGENSILDAAERLAELNAGPMVDPRRG